jgi:hypothetical protein
MAFYKGCSEISDYSVAAVKRSAAWLSLPVLVTLVICVGNAFILVSIWHHTRGQVWFTLDDAYIHLALAERLATLFHYGINQGDVAAPSSSILYPFLLAFLIKIGAGGISPLLVGLTATIAASAILANIVQDSIGLDRFNPFTWLLATVVLVFAANPNGLEFTGMEHTLQLAVCLGCVWGLRQFLITDKVAVIWLVCASVAPLIRYEDASLWAGTVFVLLYHRQLRSALSVLLLGGLPLVAFSVWLHERGLAWLPSSVLIKLSGEAAAMNAGEAALAHFEAFTCLLGASAFLLAGLVRTALATTAISLIVLGCLHLHGVPGLHPSALQSLIQHTTHFMTTYGVAQCLLIAAGLVVALQQALLSRSRARFQAAAFGLWIISGHLVFGRFGWLSRYEAYALICGAAVLVWVWSDDLGIWVSRAGPVRQFAGACGVLLVFSLYGLRAFQVPQTVDFIYRKQFQVHRFVTDYLRGPVAVNDLGLVSYRNPNAVVDLWGLGSEPARIARLSNHDVNWMDTLSRAKGAKLAVIYTGWFNTIPATWRRAGSLEVGGPDYVDSEPSVDFYATSAAAFPLIQAAMQRFKPTLPQGDSMTVIVQGR